MTIENVFEDLETQFESVLAANTAIPRAAEKLATTVAGVRITIDNPTFGSSFVAGVLGGKAIWRFQPHKTMAVFRVIPSEEALDSTARDAGELLEECLPGRFIRFNLTSDGSQIRKARVLGVLNGLILFEPASAPTGVAIERLSWLEVHASDN
ncbi:MAG: hypothetical protein RL140_34 [Actinomycetota bacterium]|jgi:hypothetical protein